MGSANKWLLGLRLVTNEVKISLALMNESYIFGAVLKLYKV